jgi:hypothetical protein
MTAYYMAYEGDIERTHHAVRLSTAFQLDAGEATVTEADLLPPSFLALAQPESPCRLPYTPRRMVLYISDVERFILPMPYRGGSPGYNQMLAEVQGNGLVKAIDILPESVNAYQVLLYLGEVS